MARDDVTRQWICRGDGIRLVIILTMRFFLLIVALTCGSSALAEQVAESGDPLGRDTPRGSFAAFIDAAGQRDFELAAKFLDLRNLPEDLQQHSGAELAEQFSFVVDRSTWIDLRALSDAPEGFAADRLPSFRDELIRIDIPAGERQLLLQRVPGDNGGRVWKVSNATVAMIPELYGYFGYPDWVEWLSQRLPPNKLFGLDVFKLVAGLIAGAVALPLVLLVGWLLAKALTYRQPALFPQLRRFFLLPVTALVVVAIAANHVLGLGVGVEGQAVMQSQTLMTICITWVLVGGVTLLRDMYARYLNRRERRGSVVLLKPIGGALKTLIVLIAAMVWLDSIGYDITAMLTGLGIGGVAVALVLQKPLEDVFGAFTLYSQQPIRIGDFGSFGGITGTIEEINLRNTRVRTLANTLITIPNAKLAGEAIENYSAREKILFRTTIRLQTDTEADTVRDVLRRVRGVLEEEPRVMAEGARARLARFGEDAIEVDVFAYAGTRAFVEFLEVVQTLNLAILDAVAAAGTRLALPAATLHLDSA